MENAMAAHQYRSLNLPTATHSRSSSHRAPPLRCARAKANPTVIVSAAVDAIGIGGFIITVGLWAGILSGAI
jgi:hypothetical protein